MGGRSFFSELVSGLLKSDEATPEDIDREVESAVQSIKNPQGETLDGSSLLVDDWESAGDFVYIMDLVPIYDAVGGRDDWPEQRMAEVCENVFGHHVREGHGHAHLKGDLFFMRFAERTSAAGFHKAAEIINDIGARMIGERFTKIKIPDLVVVTTKADISDESGHLNTAKAKVVMKSGGITFTMEEPKPDQPEWLLEYWRNRKPTAEPDDPEWHQLRRRKPSDPDWVDSRNDRRKHVVLNSSQPEQRDGTPRRATDHETEMDW